MTQQMNDTQTCPHGASKRGYSEITDRPPATTQLYCMCCGHSALHPTFDFTPALCPSCDTHLVLDNRGARC